MEKANDLFDLTCKVERETSRVFNKTVAPKGSVYLIVKVKDPFGSTYKQAALVSYDFLNDAEAVRELADKLKKALKHKYQL